MKNQRHKPAARSTAARLTLETSHGITLAKNEDTAPADPPAKPKPAPPPPRPGPRPAAIAPAIALITIAVFVCSASAAYAMPPPPPPTPAMLDALQRARSDFRERRELRIEIGIERRQHRRDRLPLLFGRHAPPSTNHESQAQGQPDHSPPPDRGLRSFFLRIRAARTSEERPHRHRLLDRLRRHRHHQAPAGDTAKPPDELAPLAPRFQLLRP